MINSTNANDPIINTTLFAIASSTANATTTLFSVSNTGNVGIGTTTPIGKLGITAGANATTTVSFGEIGNNTSHACYNTKNTAGSDISFYFVGTSMMVENNLCK